VFIVFYFVKVGDLGFKLKVQDM